MAIVKMQKLNLIAMSYDKDIVLNALQRTGAAEVTLHAETEYTTVPETNAEDLKTYLASVEAALSSLSGAVDEFEKENGVKTGVTKDGFDVAYSEFMSAKDKRAEADGAVERIHALTDRKNELKAELAKLKRQKQTAEIYAKLTAPFETFGSTAHTKGRLGTVAAQSREGLENELREAELCAYEILNADTDNVLLFVTAHKSVASETDGILSGYGFSECPYAGEDSGEKVYNGLLESENAAIRALRETECATYEMKDKIRLLKVYCDYLSFVVEKEELSDKLRTTDCTFLLQAYVPEYAKESVETEIAQTTCTAYLEFSEPTEDETPPTLLKNNAIVENFEGITNTYSAPHYRELDPNAVMSFFYSLFMGFIIGDMGYGLLMAIVGGILWWKNRVRPTGVSRLAGAFAVGGVFAVVWGALFNSFFGIAIFGAANTIMPDPQKDMWTLAGIVVPSVLLISMEIGIVQLLAGYICKTVQLWRRGDIVGGICEGIIWAVFSVGVGLAILGLIEEANVSALAVIGGIMAGVSLLLAMLTAGRKEKFFGKFTKGFGAAYGIINYASDVLSYARLYGLMLSGAVIAQIIATYSMQFLLSGNAALIVLAVVLLLVGHGFNLVISLLGAYIHDARLQYVEFYGRFYEGDGELFSALGSKQKYVYLLPAKSENKFTA